jgi:5-methylcytosine-specific restriction endonuclease McrA
MFLKPKAKNRRYQREKAARAFRDAVWDRDEGRCRHCGVWCVRTPREAGGWDDIGHVHHLRGRNVAPKDRYNPDRAVLLCAKCHRAVHDGQIVLS